MPPGPQARAGVEQASRGVDDYHGDVGFAEHLPRALDAHLAERALVVKAGRVDYHDGAYRQQLHGLLHGVGGGALDVRDEREVLTGHGVDKTGFTGVAHAEESDVQPFGGGSGVE